MSNLKKRFNLIIEDLEKNIKNKEDLEYIKTQIYNIALIFLDELDKLVEMNFNRLNVMIDREKELSRKVAKMEKILDDLEKDVYEAQDCDFEIICPYCNAEFVEEFPNGESHDVKCPECGNSIELDWREGFNGNEADEEQNDEESLDFDENEFDEDEQENDNEDDM